jgi:hypothetical protein
MDERLPLPLGTTVRPYGKISAISYRGGERYYMFTRASGKDVSLVPADIIERAYLCQGRIEHG